MQQHLILAALCFSEPFQITPLFPLAPDKILSHALKPLDSQMVERVLHARRRFHLASEAAGSREGVRTAVDAAPELRFGAACERLAGLACGHPNRGKSAVL